jgi:hypothetical protein
MTFSIGRLVSSRRFLSLIDYFYVIGFPFVQALFSLPLEASAVPSIMVLIIIPAIVEFVVCAECVVTRIARHLYDVTIFHENNTLVRVFRQPSLTLSSASS